MAGNLFMVAHLIRRNLLVNEKGHLMEVVYYPSAILGLILLSISTDIVTLSKVMYINLWWRIGFVRTRE